MTFIVRIWPFRAAPVRAQSRVAHDVRRRPLIAHWQRGSDGRLESRWAVEPSD